MSNQNINLPTNFTDLKSLILNCTQDFSGSPITNKSNNKLNEIIAKRLGFKNYDSISPLLKQEETIYPLSISYEHGSLLIEDVEIDDSIFDGDIAEYAIDDREDFIFNLMRWIVEAKDANRNTWDMEEDLKYLLNCNDEFILKSVNGAGVIAFSKEPQLFNQYCQEILNYQSNI